MRAVLFDLDDTLVEEEPTADRALRRTAEAALEAHGTDPEALRIAVRKRCRELWWAHPLHPFARSIAVASWEALWARFLGDGSELERLRLWTPEFRRRSWSAALADLDVEDEGLAAELAERFPDVRRRMQRAFPEVPDVLGALREGGRHRIGVATDGLSCLQREKAERSGVVPYLDAFVAAGDLGVRKPEPEMFRAVLGALDVAASGAVMVGNNRTSDVGGARSAGIRAVWLDRPGVRRRGGDSEVEPDARIRDLRELPEVLDRLFATCG